MEYSELILHRYSCRAYLPKPVEDEKLMKVLEAARLAPTAANRQPFQLIVIHTQGRQAELAKIYHRDWFVQAPLLICAVGVPAEGWVRSDDHRRYLDVDVAIVMDHLILEAANQGLGTCWVAAFNAKVARQLLKLPDDVEPLIFTPLGYPADQPGPKERKPLASLVRYEHW
ncbi:MAG: nitroreductase family protein [Anaerolineales bacterium]|jgi:nitroreductase|nr:nitroreductase family protein [Anaerolineales bacterium]